MNRREFVGHAAAIAIPLAWPGAPWIDVVAQHGVRNDGSEPASGPSNAERIAMALHAASLAGGTVFFQAGTYRIGGGLSVPADHITIAGEGSSTIFDLRFPDDSVDL